MYTLKYYTITAPNGQACRGQYLTEEMAEEKRQQGYTVVCNSQFIH